MRITSALTRLLCEEPITGQRVEKVEVYRVQGDTFEWLCLWFSADSDAALTALASALAPSQPCEAFVDIFENEVWLASGTPFLNKAVGRDKAIEDRWEEFPREVVHRATQQDEAKLLLARIVRDESLFDLDVVVRQLFASTWLGFRVPSARRPDRTIELVLGGQRRRLTPNATPPIAVAGDDDTLLAFYESPPESVVRIYLWVPGGDVIARSLPSAEFLSSVGVPQSRYYGYRVRLPIMLEVISDLAVSTSDLRSIVSKSSSTLGRVRSACLEAVDLAVREGIRRLDGRRAALFRRDRLYVEHEGCHVELGRVPTNENEVLILVGKLHPYIRKRLPRFLVHEHTSLLGIDALADIQLFTDGQTVLSATVEFEYSLANFFLHEHPIRQTSFVICWTVGVLPDTVDYSPNDMERGNQDIEPSEISLLGSGWIRRLNFGDHLIYVLVIEDYPGIHRAAA